MLSPSTLQVKSPEMLFLRFLKGFCKVKQRPVETAGEGGATQGCIPCGFLSFPRSLPCSLGSLPK